MATPDGSDAKPFVVISEFELSVTTTVPIVEVRADGVASARNDPSEALGVAPMGKPKIEPGLRLRLFDRNGTDLPILFTEAGQPRISLSLHNTGAFPVAVWGLPQNKDAKKVPGGDVIAATEGLTLDFHAKIEPALPPMKYEQVETNKRRPLPFVKPQVRAALLADAGLLAGLVPAEPVLDAALHVMPKAGNSVTAMAALALDRAAPPRLGSLTEGLDHGWRRAGRPTTPRTRWCLPPWTIGCSRPVPSPSSPARSISPSGWPGARRSATPRISLGVPHLRSQPSRSPPSSPCPTCSRRVPAAAATSQSKAIGAAGGVRAPHPGQPGTGRGGGRAGSGSSTASTGSPR